ncbi:hypothetical protein ABFS82_08G217600 [Erythranthe guttata]
MKRDRDRGGKAAAVSGGTTAGKGKMWAEADAGMDELLAVLGYKVKSSDMADVAEKLEQLEVAMGTTAMEDGVSSLSTDTTVHYNPSDLSGWVGSMLSELSVIPDQIGVSGGGNLINDDDLRAIPGGAILGNDSESAKKRIKFDSRVEFLENGCSAAAPPPPPLPRAVVLVDSQEAGVRLVHTLMACAEAVQQENMKLADALVKHVGILAESQVGAMRKVAACFAEALVRRIYKIRPQPEENSSYADVLEMHFYETAPYLKFAHFTANQAILEAFAGA